MIDNLVDSACAGSMLPAAVRTHLLTCRECAGRWEGEQALTSQFQAMRAELGGRRSAYLRRAEILKKFDARHPRQSLRPWWSLAAAAVLLFAVGAGVMMSRKSADHIRPAAPELSEAQTEMQEAGFIAVPFVPPLAPGELVHMVHTQLQPAALASMGVNVDPALSADMPADVLVGADGFPRAVRISEESVGEGGY